MSDLFSAFTADAEERERKGANHPSPLLFGGKGISSHAEATWMDFSITAAVLACDLSFSSRFLQLTSF